MQSDAVCWRYAGLLGVRLLRVSDFKAGCGRIGIQRSGVGLRGLRRRTGAGVLPTGAPGETLTGVSAAPRGYPLYAAGGQIISNPVNSGFGGLDDRLIAAGPIARATSPRRSSRLAVARHHAIRESAVARPDSRAIPDSLSVASIPCFCGRSFFRRPAPHARPPHLLHRRRGGVRKATGPRGVESFAALKTRSGVIFRHRPAAPLWRAVGAGQSRPGLGLLPFVDRARIRESTSRT